jgi:hypothetical protein
VAGLDLGPAPTVEVRTTPQLASYRANIGTIVNASWGKIAPEVQAVFVQLAGGSADAGERLVRATAHRFVIAHEAGHWLRHRSDMRPATRCAGEDPGASFDARYLELGQDQMRYSFYRYRFMLDALRERERLDLERMFAEMASRW